MSSDRREQVWAIAQRELDTVVRTPAYLALSVTFAIVVLAVPLLGGAGGYIPLLLNLLTPVEVLVPVVAFGFGYRAIRADAERGELDVVRTYPVARSTYVAGVFVGRGAVVALSVLVPLVLAAFAVPLADQPTPSFLATAGTVDNPAFYVRFVVLAVAYAVVALAAALAVSGLARSTRQGIGLAIVVVLVLVVGLDVAVVAGVGAGVVGTDLLGVVLAASPASAFRGLVLALGATPLSDVGPVAPTVLASVLGLLAWFGGAIALAAVTVWRE